MHIRNIPRWTVIAILLWTVQIHAGPQKYEAGIAAPYEDAIGTRTGVVGNSRDQIDTCRVDATHYYPTDYPREAGNDPHGHGGQMPGTNMIASHDGSVAPLPGPAVGSDDNVPDLPCFCIRGKVRGQTRNESCRGNCRTFGETFDCEY